MKVCFLSKYQGQVERGAENFVSELISQLDNRYQIEVFSGSQASNFKKIVGGNYDIVIPINGGIQTLAISLLRRFGGYKVLITGHSGIGRTDIWNITVGKPDIFVALTDYMASWARQWAWGTKVVQISDGVDIRKFSPIGKKKELHLERPIILSVGALVWYKHHELAIEAVSKLDKGSLLIVGKGELKGYLSHLGKKKLKDRFGVVEAKYQEMPDIYRSADIFTLPSWSREAFGLVYLEAMASNLAIVAPDDVPRRGIVGKAGVFCNVKDSDSYSQALSSALLKSFDDLPRQQAAKYSWDIVAKEYDHVFQSLITK